MKDLVQMLSQLRAEAKARGSVRATDGRNIIEISYRRPNRFAYFCYDDQGIYWYAGTGPLGYRVMIQELIHNDWGPKWWIINNGSQKENANV